jgi:hypothetical protein
MQDSLLDALPFLEVSKPAIGITKVIGHIKVWGTV